MPWKWPRRLLSGLSAIRAMPRSSSAHAEATSFEPHRSPQWSARRSMYGIWSSAWASQSRSSQPSRVFASAGAWAMMGTSSSMARFTAVPMAPEEPSTCSTAEETRSRKSTAPSAASTGSRRATFLISLTACLMRWIAGLDFQPKAWRRKRALNSHGWGPAVFVARFAVMRNPGADRSRREEPESGGAPAGASRPTGTSRLNGRTQRRPQRATRRVRSSGGASAR